MTLTKKKVLETKFRRLKVSFLLRGITKYFFFLTLSFHFCPLTVHFEFDDRNYSQEFHATDGMQQPFFPKT